MLNLMGKHLAQDQINRTYYMDTFIARGSLYLTDKNLIGNENPNSIGIYFIIRPEERMIIMHLVERNSDSTYVHNEINVDPSEM